MRKRQTCPTAVDSGALMTRTEIRVNPGLPLQARLGLHFRPTPGEWLLRADHDRMSRASRQHSGPKRGVQLPSILATA